ncbi:hypothetical protein BC829DRAFT_403721, partial [Chytridium lagenaria]
MKFAFSTMALVGAVLFKGCCHGTGYQSFGCYRSGGEPGGVALSGEGLTVQACVDRCGSNQYAFISGKPLNAVLIWDTTKKLLLSRKYRWFQGWRWRVRRKLAGTITDVVTIIHNFFGFTMKRIV